MTHRPSSSWRRGGKATAQCVTCLFVALLILMPVAAFADSKPDVPVHIGSHEAYGRVVFYLPPGTDYHLMQQGQHVVVQFAGDLTIGASRGVPRNVVSIIGGAHQAELVVAPGTALHDWRLGDLVVIDVLAAQSSAAKTEPPPAPPKALTANQPPEPASPAATPQQAIPQEPPPASTSQPSPPSTAAEQSAPGANRLAGWRRGLSARLCGADRV
jgi:hypothetical protein